MNQEYALELVNAHLRECFGLLLEAEEVRRVRRAAGVNWVVSVVAHGEGGRIFVADVDVDEDGGLSPLLTPPLVIERLRADGAAEVREQYEQRLSQLMPPPPAQEAENFILDFEDVAHGEEPPDDPDLVRTQVQDRLARGDESALREARDLMPRLLTDAERRGVTLIWMAEIERRLRELARALEHLEAAAREFADRFDLAALEKSAAMALTLMEKEKFPGSQIHKLLEASRARLRPLHSVWDASALSALHPEERDFLAGHLKLHVLSPGETLLAEGTPSRNVFIIKSGLLAVLIELPGGGERRVRYCCPGWLLGESSVLVEGEPLATATLCAEGVTEVWALDAQALRRVMAENEALRDRIAATKHVHRMDSFFTTHPALGQLEVQARDEILECIPRVDTFDEDTLLVQEGLSPEAACLVAKGEVALYRGGFDGPPKDILGADRFYGFQDALHEAPSGFSAVARAGSTIVFFDAARLRNVAMRLPEMAVGVLERLG